MTEAEIAAISGALCGNGPMWLIVPERGHAIADLIAGIRSGSPATVPGLAAAFSTSDNSRMSNVYRDGRRAFVSARGVALYGAELQPFCFSTRLLANVFDELARDKTCDEIVLILDTPGGSVSGTSEAGEAIWAARQRKPVFAVIDQLACSAGYWLASQCTRITATPSSHVGSIGVFMVHTDVSKAMANDGIKVTYIYEGRNKVEGNPFEPLSDEARAWFQSETKNTFGEFVKAVARGRGASPEKVMTVYGQGRAFRSPRALNCGMIDRIAKNYSTALREAKGSPRAGATAGDRDSRPSLEDGRDSGAELGAILADGLRAGVRK